MSFIKASMASSLAFFMFHLLIASSSFCEAIIEHGRCDLVSNELLRNNITSNLYSIERGVKMLMKEDGLVDDMKMFYGQVSMILHRFLSSKSKYRPVKWRLKNLVQHLSTSFGHNITKSAYIPEAIIDFSKHALIRAKRAQICIRRLIQCNKKTRPIDDNRFLDFLREKEMNPRCFADGTKCQYRRCAKGNRLPLCAIGFATGVTGGAAGSYYNVTRMDDNNPKNPAPGTLRHAVNFAGRNKGGVWIVFKGSMVIRLKEKLWIKSHTTIDGRGVNLTIIGSGLVLAKVENVILHNFEVVSTGNSDTVHVFDGTRRVWIDHLTSRDAYLGLVTVLQGSTDVTVSNCYLSNHNFNMLLGASDQDTADQVLRVTVYRNWFDSSNQRMPHCRWGYCHVVNNYYRDWHYYAIGGRAHAKILSERNVFEPGKRPEVTPWFTRYDSDLTPTIQSLKDLLLNGATFHQFLAYGALRPPETISQNYWLPTRPTQFLTSLVSNCSGVLFGDKVRKCIASP